MATKIRNIKNEKYWDYFILVARFLIGMTFIHYGYGKLVNHQFGISDQELITPVKDLSLFRLSWYLFDHQPFKAFIGVSQLICGTLLLWNRSVLLGAFLFLPIVINILIIDLTFMPPMLAQGFAWRLSFYILLDFLILWHYKEKMVVLWDTLWNNTKTKFQFPFWAYLILPVLAIGLEIFGVFPKIIANLIISPEATLESLSRVPELFWEALEKMGS
ncbi:DoxX family membrane protein [Flexithrix dorotheae]|uniref:DoxX family membrane protein n=1 Tax=Flexithrix dorotheae TaxID=70993 RepID=UPI0003618C55|nr:DoxX family membrane protein [Flexithrix dorotheae]